MLKKSFILLTLVFSLLFISTATFANNMLNDAAQGARNIVGGTENFVEGAVTGIGNGIREGFDTVTGNDDNRSTDEVENNMGTTTGMTDNYGATRTATTRAYDTTTGGISNTMWTWFVLAILGIVIVSLVWYYAKQNVNNSHIRDDE